LGGLGDRQVRRTAQPPWIPNILSGSFRPPTRGCSAWPGWAIGRLGAQLNLPGYRTYCPAAGGPGWRRPPTAFGWWALAPSTAPRRSHRSTPSGVCRS